MPVAIQIPAWVIVIVATAGLAGFIAWATWVTKGVYVARAVRYDVKQLFKIVARIERHTFGDSILEGGNENGNG